MGWLTLITDVLIPLGTKIAERLFTDKDEQNTRVLLRLVGEMAPRVPDIIERHGEDVKFTDIDLNSLKGEGWDE